MFKNLIFDFDGTIANTAPTTLEYLRMTLDELGRTYDKTKLNEKLFLIRTVDGIFKALQVSGDQETAMAKFFELRKSNIIGGIYIYPGVMDFMNEMKKSGKKLYIATNSLDKMMRFTLGSLNLDIFDGMRTQDHGGRNLNKAEMVADLVTAHGMNKSETLMIGDTLGDIDAGKRAGVKTAAVGWGYGDNDVLESAADFYVETAQELSAMINQ